MLYPSLLLGTIGVRNRSLGVTGPIHKTNPVAIFDRPILEISEPL